MTPNVIKSSADFQQGVKYIVIYGVKLLNLGMI